MPLENLEDVLVRSHRKSHKKCCDASNKEKPCNPDCCVPDCNPDCCTAAFQRLDKLRTEWLFVQNSLVDPPTQVFNRAGNAIAIPAVCDPSGTYNNSALTNTAAGFVNTVRYLNFEECGKQDQVVGWFVDLSNENIVLLQDLLDIGLTSCDSRADLLNTIVTQLSPTDKRKLNEFEFFWKLSVKAVARVSGNPKTEGNICEIKDKCGNRYLVAINRADKQEDVSVCDYNAKFVIVAIRLC
jgi:hypothetical protein